MSLDALRQLRRQGERPTHVFVVVGKRLPALNDSPRVVAVSTGDQPAQMDWRPVVGLPVALFVCPGADLDLAERTFDAMTVAKCEPIGAVWPDVVVTTDEARKPILRQMWELLCL